MATRYTCDHCGNTVAGSSLKKYGYGPYPQMTMVPSSSMGLINNPYGNSLQGVSQQAVLTNYPTPVDLCPHCEPIWMERVRQLTAASDPEPKPS
jgi:hypothetical protein